ncbi:hypothetical protein CHELA1G11_14296 [Hyphomicrobiales bacterium]|nr:hypothetical protein CHELA1G2_10017 [Hyphomicrobiales bacterium]CAH1677610.1 hypothetical protein CHELA1G11_14296 [Hyphomicrobiales bacterium]
MSARRTSLKMLIPGLAPGIFYVVRVDLWPATPAARGLHVRQPMIEEATVRPPALFPSI